MGFYVHINVCFACDNNEGVAALAKKHLGKITSDADGCREAKWFLEDLSNRTGCNKGPKGGLSTWGMVGNYTNGMVFVEELREFWSELLSGVDGGPLSFEHILVFVELEQSEQAKAIEIFLEGEDRPGTLKIVEHDCPFAWMQF